MEGAGIQSAMEPDRNELGRLGRPGPARAVSGPCLPLYRQTAATPLADSWPPRRGGDAQAPAGRPDLTLGLLVCRQSAHCLSLCRKRESALCYGSVRHGSICQARGAWGAGRG